jgi:hypothetical protein
VDLIARPQFWLRAAIVATGAAGLLLGNNTVIYFTAQSNLLTLAYFVGALYWMVKRETAEAPAPRLRGAVTLWILITCLISHFLLNHGANPLPGLADPDPATAVMNWSLLLVHYVVPILVLVDWVAFGPHRQVRWRDIPLWIAYPLGYGLMIEFRGGLVPAAPVRYPYFFLDPGEHGYGWVALQFLQLAVVFSLLAAAVVALDRLAAKATGHRKLAGAGEREPVGTGERGPAGTENRAEATGHRGPASLPAPRQSAAPAEEIVVTAKPADR